MPPNSPWNWNFFLATTAPTPLRRHSIRELRRNLGRRFACGIYPIGSESKSHGQTLLIEYRNVVVSFSDLVQLRFRRYRIFFGALEFRDPSAPSFLLRDRVAEGEGFYDILVRD